MDRRDNGDTLTDTVRSTPLEPNLRHEQRTRLNSSRDRPVTPMDLTDAGSERAVDVIGLRPASAHNVRLAVVYQVLDVAEREPLLNA